MDENQGGKPVTVWMEVNLLKAIDQLAEREKRSRSNAVEMLLRQALGSNGGLHPRLAELSTAYLLGHVTPDEAMREVAALVLAPSAADGRQLKLELPTPA